jgi:hypothetical protein
MEFLYSNYVNTTSSIVVDSNTDLAANLFNRDTRYQYYTNGYNGSTASTIRINFSSTQSVSRIALVDHNLKQFRIYYNGVTANAFVLTSGATTSSAFATNSETSSFFHCTPVNCTSVSIDLNSTIVASNEKAIGYLVISDVLHTFERPPPAKGYKPKLDPMDVVHKLADGGTRIQNISDNFNVQLSYKHVSPTERSQLFSLYKSHTEMMFAPFGTTTSWDKILFPCVWEGNFEFFQYSDDAVQSGFTGKINILETPK